MELRKGVKKYGICLMRVGEKNSASKWNEHKFRFFINHQLSNSFNTKKRFPEYFVFVDYYFYFNFKK